MLLATKGLRDCTRLQESPDDLRWSRAFTFRQPRAAEFAGGTFVERAFQEERDGRLHRNRFPILHNGLPVHIRK